MLTGTGSEEIAVEAMKAGLDDYVLKTARHRVRLPAAVRVALERTRERQRAEEMTRESEELYRSLFENMLNGLAYCRMLFDQGRPEDFVYLDTNGAFETLTGLKNVVGKKVSEVIPGIRESDPELFEIYGRVAVTGVPERFETYVAALKMWFAISVYCPRKDHFVALFDVISERKRAEEALRTSERRLAAIMASTLDSVVTMDVAGIVTGWNPQAEQVFGWTAQEAVGRTLADLIIPPRYRAAHEHGLAAFLASGHGPALGRRFEIAALHRQGHEFPVDLTVTPIKLEETWMFAGFIRDISLRKHAEAQRARLSAVVEQAVESVVITDTAGAIQFVNPAFERMTGYSRHEVVGRNPRILKSAKQDTAFYRTMWDKLTSGIPWTGRLVNRRRDETEYHVRQAIFPLRDSAGMAEGYVAFGQDITAEVLLESQLLQAQKMESVGRLAGGVAHDFNNLLTVILGETELVLAELPEDDSRRPGLGEVMKAAKRAEGLTRQLLAFSRQQVVEPTTFNLNDLVADVDKMLRRLIGEDIDLASRPAADLGGVKADRGQIEQVLINLAVNARDAMPEGGKLTIETANVTLDEDYARNHPYVTPGEYVLLAISDSGVGMSEEIKARIFEPFFTTKELGKGTGLGLATCYGIVKQTGGHLGVYSEVGVGTTMKVYLPRVGHSVETPSLQAAGVTARATATETETILLVEDEAAVGTIAMRILKKRGYHVLLAGSGEEALQLLESGNRIHLLLTDVVLPGMNGRALADRVWALHPDAKVLYTSGYTNDATLRHRLLEHGASFVQKPFTAAALSHKVREMLDA
jgi:PAS domain S-box-containing protein